MFKGKLGIKVLASTLVVATVAGVSLVHVSRAKANESQPWQSTCIEASEYEDTLSTQILKDNIGKMDDMSVDELLELVESEEYNRQFHRMMNKVMGTERNRVTRGGSGQEDEFTDEDCFEEEILSEEEYADEEDIDLNEQEETKDEYAISEGPSSIVTEEELEGCEVSEGPATMDNVDFEELDSEEEFDTTEETDVEVDESEELDTTEDDSTTEDKDTITEKDEQEGVEPVKEETSKLKRKFEIVKKHIGEYVDKVMAELPKVIKKVLGEQLRKMITHAV